MSESTQNHGEEHTPNHERCLACAREVDNTASRFGLDKPPGPKIRDAAPDPEPMSEETPVGPCLVLVDGDTVIPLDPAALAVALFATLPDARKGEVLAIATALTAELAKGHTLKLQAQRIARPTGLVP